jgi:hypothetical protein
VATFTRTLDLRLLGPDLRPRRVSLLSPTVGRFTLELSWNPRAHRSLAQPTPEDGLYFFKYTGDDGTVRIRSRAVTLNADMLASARAGDPDIAPGVLRCEGPRDPGRYDLSDGTCTITYVEEVVS